MKKVLLSLVVLGVLSLSGAFAQQGGGYFGPSSGGQKFDRSFYYDGYGCGGHFMGKKGFMRSLNLTQDQRDQMIILRDEMVTQMRDAFSQLNSNQNYFTENSFDRNAFLKDADDRHSVMSKIRADHFEKVYNILTLEQRAEFSQNFQFGGRMMYR